MSLKEMKMPNKKSPVTSRQSSVKTEKAASKTVKPAVVKKSGGLSVPVYSMVGAGAGSLDLPKEVFGARVNETLLKQALRVYMTNNRIHGANTKTRGEVQGSTRKIYKQKGTGKARHGGITAPIFVGGGIALGPRTRKVRLDLPDKMKRAALISALSQRALESEVIGLSGAEKSTGKTKDADKLVKKINKKSILVVGQPDLTNLFRSLKNLQGVDFISPEQVNVYEVIRHNTLVLTKEAVERLSNRLTSKKEGKNETK